MPTLTIDIAARLASLHDSLDQVGRRTEQMTRRLDKAFGTVKTSIAALGTGLAAGGFVTFVKSGIDAADSMAKLAAQTGVSVESLSGLQYAAGLSAVKNEELTQALSKLAKAASDTAANTGEARGAFQALGVSVKDASGNLKGTEALLLELADKFAGIADGTGKSALAMKLFGESGARLIPFLNQGRGGLEGLRKEAERLGIVISGDTARAAADLNDNLARIGKQTEALRNALVENLIGPLGNVIQKMAEATKAGKGFFGTLQAPFRLNDLELAEREITSVTDRLLRSERQLAEMRRTSLSEPTAKALEASIARDRQRAEELVRLLKYLRGETNALGDPTKREDGTKPQAPGLASTGADKGAEFLESLRKRLLGIRENEFALLELEARQRGVAEAAAPLIAAIQRETEFRKALADATARDAQAVEAEQQRRAGIVNGIGDYVEKLREETSLLGLSNEQRDVEVRLLELEKAGLDRTSESFKAAAENLRSAVFASAGAKLVESLKSPLERVRDELVRINALYAEGAITAEQMRAAVEKLNGEFNKSKAASDSTTEAAKELGLVFKSSFERALDGGENLRGLLKGLEADLLKLGTRRLVLEPLFAQFEKLLKPSGSGGGGLLETIGSFVGGLFGGARAEGGPVDAGRGYVVGERGPEWFVPRQSGQIIPAGMGGTVINYSPKFVLPQGPVTPQSRSQIAAAALRGLEYGRRNQ